MTQTETITLQQGQQVAWPRSPDGVAQVGDLKGRRTRVELLYRRGARLCRAIVPVRRVARIEASQPVLPGFELPFNYLGRASVGPTKTFELFEPSNRRPTPARNAS